jgi:hypothetical protein
MVRNYLTLLLSLVIILISCEPIKPTSAGKGQPKRDIKVNDSGTYVEGNQTNNYYITDNSNTVTNNNLTNNYNSGNSQSTHKGNLFNNNVAFAFNEKMGDCDVNNECDCCGGVISFDTRGYVILVFYCMGNATTYNVGKYNIVSKGIVCEMGSKSVEEMINDSGILAAYINDSKPFQLTLLKSNCRVYHNQYELKFSSSSSHKYYSYNHSNISYLSFMEVLKKWGVYSKIEELTSQEIM